MTPDEVLLELREMPEWLECPICDKETNALKEFLMLDEYFSLFVYHRATTITITACPRCMRLEILKRLGTMVLSSNLFWPIVPLPVFSLLLVKTVLPGHSPSIQREFKKAFELAKRRKEWAEEDNKAADSN